MAGACLLALVLCILGTPVLLKTREIHQLARVTTTDYDTSQSSTNIARMHRMVDPGVHYVVGLFVDGLVMRKQRTQYGKSRMIRILGSTKHWKLAFDSAHLGCAFWCIFAQYIHVLVGIL